MSIMDIIKPEIFQDDFYNVIHSLAKREDLKTFLEIGSSSGGGSTDAFVKAIRNRPDSNGVRLFCMELSEPRFKQLSEAYKLDEFVNCYNISSVTLDAFPSEEEVVYFYKNVRTKLRRYPQNSVLEW